MKIIDSTADLDQIQAGLVLTIGNFDGVHLGHQQILKAARRKADKTGAPGVAAMTFYPHPVAILHPEKAPGVLTPLEIKKHLLQTCGVDYLIVLTDSYELLNLSPEDFIDEFLIKHVQPSAVVEGPNFNFGYGRSGDINTLQDLGKDRGFEVVVVGPEKIKLSNGKSTIISSSLIRQLLEAGKVGEAAAALGRPYRLIGQTIPGRGKGTQLGFPTANIQPEKQVQPDEGVYAGFVQVGRTCQDVCVADGKRPAAFSIGRAKTFIGEHPVLTEAHILDEQVEDLRDKWLAMDFVAFIRHQRRFEDEEQLKKQIAEDCETARKILTEK